MFRRFITTSPIHSTRLLASRYTLVGHLGEIAGKHVLNAIHVRGIEWDSLCVNDRFQQLYGKLCVVPSVATTGYQRPGLLNLAHESAEGVRIRPGRDVVAQSCYRHVLYVLRRNLELGLFLAETFDEFAREVGHAYGRITNRFHDTEGVLEDSVISIVEDEDCAAQGADRPQALERWCVYYLPTIPRA